MTDLPHALVIDPRPQCYAETLTTRFADRCRFTFCTVEAEVDAALARADFQIVFEVGIADAPRAKLREVYLAPSLQWFQVGGSGYEHILPMERADVQVSNAAGVLAPFLAETIMGAMLAIEGQFFRYRDLQRARVWQPLDFGPLAGRTLLIVGLGAIGSELAQRAAAFDMRVLATRRTPAPDPHCAEVHPADALDALLPEADFISLHLRLDAATHHPMNAARFARMKPGSVMINTARGKV
ncbi:MAG: NAD(P)-dependent oxidoreductase, partial [Pseudomonadota bacterium]